MTVVALSGESPPQNARLRDSGSPGFRERIRRSPRTPANSRPTEAEVHRLPVSAAAVLRSKTQRSFKGKATAILIGSPSLPFAFAETQRGSPDRSFPDASGPLGAANDPSQPSHSTIPGPTLDSGATTGAGIGVGNTGVGIEGPQRRPRGQRRRVQFVGRFRSPRGTTREPT